MSVVNPYAISTYLSALYKEKNLVSILILYIYTSIICYNKILFLINAIMFLKASLDSLKN